MSLLTENLFFSSRLLQGNKKDFHPTLKNHAGRCDAKDVNSVKRLDGMNFFFETALIFEQSASYIQRE